MKRRVSRHPLFPIILWGFLLFLPRESSGTVEKRAPLGPAGGTVRVIVADPADPALCFAGTEGGGIFRSKDGGKSWAAAGAGFPPAR